LLLGDNIHPNAQGIDRIVVAAGDVAKALKAAEDRHGPDQARVATPSATRHTRLRFPRTGEFGAGHPHLCARCRQPLEQRGAAQRIEMRGDFVQQQQAGPFAGSELCVASTIAMSMAFARPWSSPRRATAWRRGSRPGHRGADRSDCARRTVSAAVVT
jgi:hypothetical protein